VTKKTDETPEAFADRCAVELAAQLQKFPKDA
jgi:hypothetical protein